MSPATADSLPVHAPRGAHGRGRLAALMLGATGVVYGDIGTSPLYTLKTIFTIHPAIAEADVLGVLSLIFWSLMLVVTVKFVFVIMHADNRGEGGVLALSALARQGLNRRSAAVVAALGLLGMALFMGDSLITPAISVLSAMEGMDVAAPSLSHFVVPVTLVIIVVLFVIQSWGTETVGKLFGPVMTAWFAIIGTLGVIQIWHNPSVLRALSPTYGAAFFMDNGWASFFVLGGVVLAVTGGEALYADMGHFGRRPIALAWLYFVLPSLVLNYFGQGALLLRMPKAIENRC
jgi:KUP system potassium uptake protein